MANNDFPVRDDTKSEILRRNRAAFEELEEILASLDDVRLSEPGTDGWAIKDHLAHLAAWQIGIVHLLQRKDRFAAMGLDRAAMKGKSEDEINDKIYELNARLTPAQAWDLLRDAHTQMEAQLESMSSEDLYRPYASYLPEGVRASQDPVLNWVVGDGYEHYREHIGWLRELIAEES